MHAFDCSDNCYSSCLILSARFDSCSAAVPMSSPADASVWYGSSRYADKARVESVSYVGVDQTQTVRTGDLVRFFAGHFLR